MGKQKYPQASTASSAEGDTKTTGGKRKHYSHAKADARKDKRRQEAEARQRVYDSTPISKLISIAKSRRGKSKRELAKLNNPNDPILNPK